MAFVAQERLDRTTSAADFAARLSPRVADDVARISVEWMASVVVDFEIVTWRDVRSTSPAWHFAVKSNRKRRLEERFK